MMLAKEVECRDSVRPHACGLAHFALLSEGSGNGCTAGKND